MMFVYRIYQFVIMIPLMVVVTVVTALIVMLGSIVVGPRLGYYPAHVWARVMAWLSLVRVTVKGRENVRPGRACIFVANHQGAYDIFAIYGWLNHHFVWMMKQSLRKIPLVGYACYRAGHIYVNRRTPADIKRTMETAERRLGEGYSVVVFPEGTRTKTGRLGAFKRGAFHLAEEFSLPVVPVTISGSYHVMPPQARLPRPGHITLTIHRPIEPPEDGRYDVAELMSRSREAIASALMSGEHRGVSVRLDT